MEKLINQNREYYACGGLSGSNFFTLESPLKLVHKGLLLQQEYGSFDQLQHLV